MYASSGCATTRLRALLPQTSFARDVGLLAGGAAATQLIGLVAALVLTRLYSAEEFGVLAIFTAVLLVLSVVATVRYELAIPLPESEKDAASVVVVALGFVLLATFATGLAVALSSGSIASVLNTPGLRGYLWMLPIAVFVTAAYQVFSFFASRHKQFSLISKTRISQTLTMVSIQLGGHSFGAGALLAGFVAGQSVGVVTLARNAMNSSGLSGITTDQVVRTLGRYRSFALFAAFQALCSTASRQLPLILLAVFFNPVSVGLFALAVRIIEAPLAFVSLAVSNVLLAHGSEALRRGELGVLVQKIYRNASSLAIPLVLGLVVSGPEMFALAFGDEWKDAGAFARLLAPWVYIVSIATSLGALFAILEKQAQGAAFQGVLLALRACALITGGYLGSPVVAIALYSIVTVLCWSYFLLWSYRLLGIPRVNLLVVLGKPLAAGVCIVAPLPLAKFLNGGQVGFLTALFAAGAMAAIYYTKLVREAY